MTEDELACAIVRQTRDAIAELTPVGKMAVLTHLMRHIVHDVVVHDVVPDRPPDAYVAYVKLIHLLAQRVIETPPVTSARESKDLS